MISEIHQKHGGPAFPLTIDDGPTETYFGMSLRDYFAAAALTGLCANHQWDDNFNSPQMSAGCAYRLADAMLAERSKTERAP